MTDYLKTYWPIFFSIATVLVSLIAQWAVLGVRLSAVEARQDRQSMTIMQMQTTITLQASDIASMKATLVAIDNNVDYIRQRIDRVVSN